ncbi:MAG: 3-dehydroquinate dehydratase [Microbispora sp.]|nr:3-dehydroquinate dehydratase [Microbispora sp.]
MTPRILLVHGPNLGRLGSRRPEVYGNTTLPELEESLRRRAGGLGAELCCFQSDVEGEIIRFVDAHRDAKCLILNPGALMMSGWCLRDCLEDFRGLKIEVHISQVFARESFRHSSVLAGVMDGFICGLGLDGYHLALDAVSRRLAAGRA